MNAPIDEQRRHAQCLALVKTLQHALTSASFLDDITDEQLCEYFALVCAVA